MENVSNELPSVHPESPILRTVRSVMQQFKEEGKPIIQIREEIFSFNQAQLQFAHQHQDINRGRNILIDIAPKGVTTIEGINEFSDAVLVKLKGELKDHPFNFAKSALRPEINDKQLSSDQIGSKDDNQSQFKKVDSVRDFLDLDDYEYEPFESSTISPGEISTFGYFTPEGRSQKQTELVLIHIHPDTFSKENVEPVGADE